MSNTNLIIYDLFENCNLFNRGCGYCNQSKLVEISKCSYQIDIFLELYRNTKLTDKEIKELSLKSNFKNYSSNIKVIYEIDSKQIQLNPKEFKLEILDNNRLTQIYIESKLTELELQECIKNAEKWILMIGKSTSNSFIGYIKIRDSYSFNSTNFIEKYTHITWPTLSSLIGLIYLKKISSFGIKEEQHFHSN